MMKKMYKLTKDGVAELEAELKQLVAERPEITERIKTAREMGDLSENAEYASARNEQASAEARIAELEHILKNVELIKNPKKEDKVHIGSTVKLKGSKGEKVFKVVGTVEADPLQGKISDESPIGQALLGKAVGQDVEIVTPSETVQYKVVSIT
jgi:transcription elongation factor GreA